MFTAIAIAISALASDISHTVSSGPVYELAPITIVTEVPEPTAWVVCEESETSHRCDRFVADTIEEAMGAARALVGQGATLSARVSK